MRILEELGVLGAPERCSLADFDVLEASKHAPGRSGNGAESGVVGRGTKKAPSHD